MKTKKSLEKRRSLQKKFWEIVGPEIKEFAKKHKLSEFDIFTHLSEIAGKVLEWHYYSLWMDNTVPREMKSIDYSPIINRIYSEEMLSLMFDLIVAHKDDLLRKLVYQIEKNKPAREKRGCYIFEDYDSEDGYRIVFYDSAEMVNNCYHSIEEICDEKLKLTDLPKNKLNIYTYPPIGNWLHQLENGSMFGYNMPLSEGNRDKLISLLMPPKIEIF